MTSKIDKSKTKDLKELDAMDEVPVSNEERDTEEVPKYTEVDEELKKEPETTDAPVVRVKDQEEDAPAPPPRPVSPATKAKNDLKEAFPSIEEKYIIASLIASRGATESAFEALLYISDPSVDIQIPSAPLVPVKTRSTLSDDELYARRLQKEFEAEEKRRRRETKQKRMEPVPRDGDSPDEFEQIKETFSSGVQEARTTLNGWVSALSKKFQERDADNTGGPKLFGALGGSSYAANRGGGKFDEDPEIISDDFHKISLTNNDDGEESAPSLPGRKEATQPKEKDSLKWQSLGLTTPMNSDAFLVTDSEDEETTKK